MGASLWERLPAASSCSFLPQQQELAPMGRSYNQCIRDRLVLNSTRRSRMTPASAASGASCR